MSEPQSFQRGGQWHRSLALLRATWTRNHIVCAHLSRPDLHIDGSRDLAPDVGIGGNQDFGGTTARQARLDRGCTYGIVEDEKDAVAFVTQSFRDSRKSGLLFFVCRDPSKSNPKANDVGTHGGLSLRSDPPGCTIIGAVTHCVSRRKRGLTDAAKPVQRRDGDAALIPGKDRLDVGQDIIAPDEMARNRNRDVRWVGLARKFYCGLRVRSRRLAPSGKCDRVRRLRRRRQKLFQARASLVLQYTVKLAVLEGSQQGRRLTRLDIDRKQEVRPLRRCCPLRGAPLQSGV